MQDLLFDAPWWLPTFFAAIGIGLFIQGNRRQNTTVRTVGVAVLAVGILIAALSYFVDTDKEKAQKRTRTLVDAAVARDWKTFESLIDPNASMRLGTLTLYPDRESLVAGARKGVEQFGLKGATVTAMEANQTGPIITVTMRVYTTQDYSMDRPVSSEWEFDWEQLSQGWAMHQARVLRIHDLTEDQMRGHFPR